MPIWVGVSTACVFVTGTLCGSRVLSAQQTIAATRNVTDERRETEEMLARRVTVTLARVSRAAAIDSISQVAKVLVQYRARMLNTDTTMISVHAVAQPLGMVLEEVLAGTGLRVMFDGHQKLYVTTVGDTASRDSVVLVGTVTGRVVDSATGRGLSGATIKVAGTKMSIITQDSGRFTLRNVAAGQTVLTVKIFGYRPIEQEVHVSSAQTTTVRIRLVEAMNVLSGVVTTATGRQRRIEVGNDITSINVDSVMQVAPISSVTDLLETRVPGLTVLHSSGTPGDPSRLRLRGPGSITLNNDPIVIVDGVRVYASQSDPRNVNLSQRNATQLLSKDVNPAGIALQNGTATAVNSTTGVYTVPSPIDQIDPSSIETIEVLKGPSATAIYGSDAAAGVIVITTKHGRAGPTHWDLSLTDGMNWRPGNWPDSYFRFGTQYVNANGIQQNSYPIFCQWYELDCTVDSVVAFQALNDPRYTVFGVGRDQQAGLTIQGGVSTLTYSLTGSGGETVGNLKLPGIEQQRYDSAYGPIPHDLLRPDNLTTWGVRGLLTAVPASRMQVTLESSLFNSLQKQSSLQSAITQLEGVYISPTLLKSSLIANEFERATANTVTSTNAATLTWQPVTWLPLTATGGISTGERTDITFLPHGISNAGFSSPAPSDTNGNYGIVRGETRNPTLSVGTEIPLRFAKVALGGTLFSESASDLSANTDRLAPGVTIPSDFSGLVTSATNNVIYSSEGRSTYGWYVAPTLTLLERLYFTPGFRLDGGNGGSTSGGTLSPFPKIDLSYIAINRQGEHPLWGLVTLLRPRLAFGVAGNQPSPDQKLRLYNVGAYNSVDDHQNGGALGYSLEAAQNCGPGVTLDGVTVASVVCLSDIGNPLLRPERTVEVEGGGEIDLWNNRLQLTYTRYNKITKDALISVPVAFSVIGAFDQEVNLGKVRNTGTELSLDAVLLESRAVSWRAEVSLSNNNSLIMRLNPGIPDGCGGACNGSRLIAGYPLTGLWAQPISSFADVNHDGRIEPSEIRLADSSIYIGQSNPKYELNFHTGVTLFNGRLGAFATFSYQNGLTQTNQGACLSQSFTLLPNNPSTPLATQAAIVAAGCGVYTGLDESNQHSPIGLTQTVNTLRFNELSINYTLPQTVSAWFRVPRMALSLQGKNLGLRTNYRGIDPDVNAFSTVTTADETVDLGQLPEPRTWWLNMRLGN